MAKKLVACRIADRDVLEHPEELDLLKDKVGLTTAMLGGPFDLSPETRALNPYPKEVRDKRGPGLGLTGDDSIVRRAVDLAHAKGLEVWFNIGGWNTGDVPSSELAIKDLWGRPLNKVGTGEYSQARFAKPSGNLCPNNEAVNRWFEAAYAEAAAKYGAEGVYAGHSRYDDLSVYPAIFACGCESCQQAAKEMGYDFEDMQRGVQEVWERLQRLDARKVKLAAEVGLNPFDLLELLGGDTGVIEWLNFRAASLGRQFARFTTALHKATNGRARFGAQAYPASFELLVGHLYKDYAGCDFMVPPLMWIGGHFMDGLAAWADFILRHAPGIEEKDAVRFLYRLFGYDVVEWLPLSIDGMHLHQGAIPAERLPDYRPQSISGGGAPAENLYFGPYMDLVELEMKKIAILRPSAIPFYPLLRGAVRPRVELRRQFQLAESLGFEGWLIHGYEGLL